MEEINVREYIIHNFENDSIEEIRESIVSSILSKEEDTLIGLGVMFEILWNGSSEEEQNKILEVLKKGLIHDANIN